MEGDVEDICVTPNHCTLILGDNYGNVLQMDIRKKKVDGKNRQNLFPFPENVEFDDGSTKAHAVPAKQYVK